MADLQADQRLAEIVICLGDHEVDTLIGSPAQLLGIHAAHYVCGTRVLRVIRPGVADVAGHQGAALGRHLTGQPHRMPVHGLQVTLAAYLTQLLAVGVVGERHHHVSARAQELPVQLADRLREVEHRLGHISACLDVAPTLQLEHISLSPQHRAQGKAVGQSRPRTCHNRPSLLRSRILISLPQTADRNQLMPHMAFSKRHPGQHRRPERNRSHPPAHRASHPSLLALGLAIRGRGASSPVSRGANSEAANGTSGDHASRRPESR
jgi:hypothetical protein